jgi:hypothetical protein
MAQTTGGIPFTNAVIEYSLDEGSSWTDMSGFASKVENSGGDRQSGEAYTADGDAPIIGQGKREPTETKVTVVFTEATDDPFYVIEPYHKAGSPVLVRWASDGTDTGALQFTTDSTYAVLVNINHPGGDVAPGDPIVTELTVKASEVDMARL